MKINIELLLYWLRGTTIPVERRFKIVDKVSCKPKKYVKNGEHIKERLIQYYLILILEKSI
eukprot:snap_masked-scaffold_1-processed-gene-5.25-mRNA-1 protein AED:1.00 eAED:1.00 QI:0/0/0/0/1/1/4/0/60